MVLLALAVVLLGAGCSRGHQARSFAKDSARRVGLAMSNSGFDDAIDLAAVVSGPGVEVLEAEGDRFTGGTILVRIRATAQDPGGATTVERCYRYDLGHATVGEPRGTGCPSGAERIEIPDDAGIRPSVPAEVRDGLAPELQALVDGDRATPDAVEEVLSRLTASTETPYEVHADGDVIGVAVGYPGFDCDFVRVAGGAIESWHVPDVVSAPGELGCSAEVAAAGGGRSSPH
jgi:hypothetical protein